MTFVWVLLAIAAILWLWAGIVYLFMYLFMGFAMWMLPSNHPKLSTYFPTKEAIDES